MTSYFHPGSEIKREDLCVIFTDDCGSRTNLYEISYALFYVDPGPPETEVLIGAPQRTPVNPELGEYYAALFIPASAVEGGYRVRWTFRMSPESSPKQVVMNFQVVQKLEDPA